MIADKEIPDKVLERALVDIEVPDVNDVPMGRGAFVNAHPGHRQYIKMVNDRKMEYVSCKKSAKSKIAWSIVRDLRSLDPPARFLQKDVSTGLWNDVGDKKFRVKVSQALREHQPFIKALMDNDVDDDASAGLHADKRSETNQSRSFDKNMDTISEQPMPASMGQPRLCNTEDRRRAFASSRMESVSAVTGGDGLEWPTGDDPSISEFTVSEFNLSERPFVVFPSSTTVDRHCGGHSLPAQQPCDSFPGSKSSNNSKIPLYETLEQEDVGHGRIEWNSVQAFARPVLVKRETSHDNETPETKRGLIFGGTVKRCVLTRDKSDVARQLKQTSCSAFNTADQSGSDLSEMDSLLDALGRDFPFP